MIDVKKWGHHAVWHRANNLESERPGEPGPHPVQFAGCAPLVHALLPTVSCRPSCLGESGGCPYSSAPVPGGCRVGALRYLTILWPGLPWLWLRGSAPGFILAAAFGVTLNVAMVTTWVWTDLVDLPFRIAAWAGAAAIWMLATASAVSAFPPPIPRGRSPSVDALFEEARNCYLARDWVGAEQRLRDLLRLAPTDGEAQLLLGTLLRRVGRLPEARGALEALARSDAGAPWRGAISREMSLVSAAESASVPQAAGEPDIVPLARPRGPEPTLDQGRAAA